MSPRCVRFLGLLLLSLAVSSVFGDDTETVNALDDPVALANPIASASPLEERKAMRFPAAAPFPLLALFPNSLAVAPRTFQTPTDL